MHKFIILCLTFLSSVSASIAQTPSPGSQPSKRVFQPPLEYPADATAAQLEGACVMKFDLTSAGEPTHVKANCSDAMFDAEARRIISGSIYTPKIVSGVPVMRANLIETIMFELGQTAKPAPSPVAATPVTPPPTHADVQALAQKLDALSYDTATMKCAEIAKKQAKPDNKLKSLGAVAKFAGYGDVAKGIGYYTQAETVIQQLTKEEKSLFQICMRDRGHAEKPKAGVTVSSASAAPIVSRSTLEYGAPADGVAAPADLPAGAKRVTLIRDGEIWPSMHKKFVLIDDVKVAEIKQKKPLTLVIAPDAKTIRMKVAFTKMKKFDLTSLEDGQTLRLKHNKFAMRGSHMYVFEVMDP